MPAQRKLHSVLVVDARELRRAGVVALLSSWAESNNLEVLASAPEEALDCFENDFSVQMIVIGLGSQSISDREMMQRIKVLHALAPGVPIVALSDREEPDEVIASLSAGLQGFLPSSIGQELALQALSFIVKGGSYFPPSAIRNLPMAAPQNGEPNGGGSSDRSDRTRHIPSSKTSPDDGEQDLRNPIMTSRQQDVLHLLKDGKPNKVIARQLGMTEGTVKVHVRQIMRKLGASNRTQAALCAISALPDDDDPTPTKPGENPPTRSGHHQLWAAE